MTEMVKLYLQDRTFLFAVNLHEDYHSSFYLYSRNRKYGEKMVRKAQKTGIRISDDNYRELCKMSSSIKPLN